MMCISDRMWHGVVSGGVVCEMCPFSDLPAKVATTPQAVANGAVKLAAVAGPACADNNKRRATQAHIFILLGKTYASLLVNNVGTCPVTNPLCLTVKVATSPGYVVFGKGKTSVEAEPAWAFA